MNKTLIILLILLSTAGFSTSGVAEKFPTGKGSKLIKGGFTFSSAGGDMYKYGDSRVTTLDFYPSISVFIAPRLAVGSEFIISRTAVGDESVTTWGIGPQIMYFFGGNQPQKNIHGSVYPYLHGAFYYERTTNQDEYYGEVWKTTISSKDFDLGFGICYMLSNALGLFGEASLRIRNITSEEDFNMSSNNINLLAGLTVFLY